MRRTDTFRWTLFAFLSALIASAAVAAAPAGWQKIDVLERRLSVQAPPGTQRVAKEGTSLARAGEQTKSDHYDINVTGVALRLVATELLIHADALTAASSTLAVARFPGGYPVASTVLPGADKNLLRVDIYAQSEAAAQSAAAKQAAAAICASALAGPRRLNAGKDVKLLGGELTIDLLAGYTTVVESRERASIVNIVRIGNAGEPVSAAIMYVGHNVRPSPPIYPVEQLALFGRTGTWSRAPGDGGQVERSVWLLSATDPEDEPQVQFRIMAASVATEQELVKIVKSIRSRSLH